MIFVYSKFTLKFGYYIFFHKNNGSDFPRDDKVDFAALFLGHKKIRGCFSRNVFFVSLFFVQ